MLALSCFQKTCDRCKVIGTWFPSPDFGAHFGLDSRVFHTCFWTMTTGSLSGLCSGYCWREVQPSTRCLVQCHWLQLWLPVGSCISFSFCLPLLAVDKSICKHWIRHRSVAKSPLHKASHCNRNVIFLPNLFSQLLNSFLEALATGNLVLGFITPIASVFMNLIWVVVWPSLVSFVNMLAAFLEINNVVFMEFVFIQNDHGVELWVHRKENQSLIMNHGKFLQSQQCFREKLWTAIIVFGRQQSMSFSIIITRWHPFMPLPVNNE